MKFKGKIVLVTAITSDIGMAIAIAFAREGAEILATGRTISTATKLLPDGATGWFSGGDLSEPRVMERLRELLPLDRQVDVIVNATGAWHSETEAYWDMAIAEIPLAAYAEAMNAGPIAVANVVSCFLPRMRPGGSIVNMSAHFDQGGQLNYYPYWSACKSVEGLTKGLSQHLSADADRRIRVNCVAPSYVDTRALRIFLPEYAERERLLSPEEVARVVLDLADPACRKTGEVVPILPKRG